MLQYLIQGLILGFSYVAPIGMQNLYVINTAISMDKRRAYEVAGITIFFDVTLSVASFFGIGVLMDKVYLLKLAILFIGAIVVIYIGTGLIKSKPQLSNKVDVNISLYKVIMACFTVTWFNPQAIIDGSLLLGSFRASLPFYALKFFIAGVCIASFIWFTALATTFSMFKNNFNEKLLRKINVFCGCIIIYYGIKLAYSFITLILH